jgi:hypothetical protein
MATGPQRQPYVEDYFSDTERKASPTANSSTKRSHPDLKPDAAPPLEKMHPNIDLKSDSGYSSFTAASKSSADTAPSTKAARSPPAAPATAAPMPAQSPASKARRPTLVEQRQAGSESARPRPTRAPSMSSKNRPPGQQRRPTITTQDEGCTEPGCTTCGPNAVKPSRPRRPTLSSLPSDQRSNRSAPDTYYSPPSPAYARQPNSYQQGPAIVQPAQSNHRRMSSSARQRPLTFAGEPPASYWVPGMPAPYTSPPQDQRGPPPSMSAYQNYSHIPAYMAPPAPPLNYYPPPQADLQRPPLANRQSSTYTTRSQPPAVVTQDNSYKDPGKFSARYGQPPTPSEYQMKASRQPKQLQLQYGDEEFESDSASGDEYAYEDRQARDRDARAALALMPPPKIKQRDKSQRRPQLPHANTTQVVDTRRDERRQSFILSERPVRRERESERERPRERERERERVPPRVTAAPARHPSVGRPVLAPRHVQSEYDTRHAQIVVNNSKSSRRQSYQGGGRIYDALGSARALEDQYNAERRRENRASRIYEEERFMPGRFEEDDEDEEPEEPVRALTRPRRKTDSELRKGKERIPEGKNKRAETAAEEYIKTTRGSHDPYADQINRAAKRASGVPSAHSESGSSDSNGSGIKSISQRTDGGNNEIRLRVDAGAPLSLQFTGDMEGRTLQLIPGDNGMTDVVIGGTNAETIYHQSERGSIVSSNRRLDARQPRREAEDLISERSSRSGRSRREREDVREARDGRVHVLQRSRNSTYD